MTSRPFEEWVAAFRNHLAPTSREPIGLVIDRAEGPWVFAPDGRRYLDLLAGIGVANLGHTHPEVVAAVETQIRRYHHAMVYGEYVLEEQALYARELAEAVPGDHRSVFFVNSGAEAVEGAMKLVRKATGRSRFVSFDGAYHGDTFGALSLSGNAVYRDPFEPLLKDVTRLPFGRIESLGEIDERVAGVILEPVQGEGGVRVPEPEFLPAVAARCRETGARLILDEVMTGMGRTGRFTAAEHWGVVPDVLVLAKAVGGGFPLGAFVADRALLDTLAEDPPLAHVTTFGGHPVSCAAGRAALRVLLRDRLVERAETVGGRWQALLRDRLIPGGAVAVRGLGLFIGIELADAAVTRRFVDGCRDRGILLGWTLHHDHIIRLAPPLVTPEGILEEAAVTMEAALRAAIG